VIVIKKLQISGGSHVIVVPELWLKSLERAANHQIEYLNLDIQDDKIIIMPVWEDQTT
jgi:hypothetical protein